MKNKLNIIFSEFFHTFFYTYIVLLLIEIIFEGTVSNFFNLNYLLGISLLCGLFMIVTEERSKKFYITHAGESDWENVFLLSVLAGLIIYSKTRGFGPVSIAVSLTTVFVVLSLSILTLKDGSKEAKVITMQLLKDSLPVPHSILTFLVQLDALDRLTFFKMLHHAVSEKKGKKTPPKS